MVREMMVYHVRQFTEPRHRVEQARAFLTFLTESHPADLDTTYHRMLTDEAETLREAADSYLFHEHLEEVNQPLYFHEFMDRASAKGLQYLDEARAHSPLELFSAQTRAVLGELAADPLRQEQYLDFLRNRTFRRTLLCHAHQPLDRASQAPQRMAAFQFSCTTWPPSPDIDVTTADTVEFRGENFQASTNMPLVKAALVELCKAFPRAVPFETLLGRVWDRLKGGCAQPLREEEAPGALAAALFRCYRSGLARIHVFAPPFVVEFGERPRASILARRQALQGMTLISNLRHASVMLDERERLLLTLLDGSRNHAGLAQAMALAPEESAADWLGAKLTRLARLALLTA
jgi:hypothetical protein